MNYYKRHLGDYSRDAGHLSMLEHGAYTMLLDRYYTSEKPIPKGDVYRITRARSKPEKEATDVVLSEFFILDDAGYRNRRADEELNRYASQRETNRETGKKGGRPKKESKQEPNGNRFGFESDTETEPNNNPNPESIIHETTTVVSLHSPNGELSPASAAAVPPCPAKQIIAAYHDELPELPAIREFPEAAAKAMRVRWRENPERRSVDWWRDWFRYVKQSDFLMGRATDFQADLIWLVTAKNFAKVMNGNYENRR